MTKEDLWYGLQVQLGMPPGEPLVEFLVECVDAWFEAYAERQPFTDMVAISRAAKAFREAMA